MILNSLVEVITHLKGLYEAMLGRWFRSGEVKKLKKTNSSIIILFGTNNIT
jgi:hypothetical protein